MTEDGAPEAEAEDGGFAAVRAAAFPVPEQSVVFALVGAVASTRASEGALHAFEAVALTNLVAVAHDRAAMARADGRDHELPMREIAAEVGAALRISDRTAQRTLSDAVTLTTAFPATHQALSEGRVSRSHVSVIIEAGAAIGDDESRGRYEREVLPRAEAESAGRLRPIARLLAERAHPTSIEDRHRRARRDRNVVVTDADDGMALLSTYLPAALAHGIMDRLTQMAHAVRQAEKDAEAVGGGVLDGFASLLSDSGDSAHSSVPERAVETESPRSIGELRADLLSDLLLTGAPSAHGDGLAAITAHVQVTVPVLTLAGASDDPALLAGHGPVDLDTARRLAATAPGWDRVLTHPFTGSVLGVDRYRPSGELRRFLRIRDQHCRFPACRMPPWRSDVDHTVDAAHGGPTCEDNLATLCRRHHTLKHHTAWRVKQRSGGVLHWTSPSGRTYTDTPERTLLFVGDSDPPPF